DLVARTPEEHRANGIGVRTRHEVVSVDTQEGAITVRDLEAGSERREHFDALVIATGAVPVRPKLPGVHTDGVHGIQTITDGLALRDHVSSHRHANQRAVVVGAGYIGLEMAEALHQRGMPVTVVEGAGQPMSTLDPDMGPLVGDAIRSLGIELRTSTKVVGFEADGDGHVRAVVTEDGTLPADVVVLGIGVRPNVALARDAGIAIGDKGGIATDARMATSVDGVWAAGDCIETHHRVTGAPALVALGTHANKQGRVAGENATGGDATFAGVIGTAITKVCDTEAARTGLSAREAEAAGYSFVTAVVDSTTRAGYFPGATSMKTKLIAERRTGRLLGAQIIGKEGAAKRIDGLAIALWNRMTVEDMSGLDLSYAPPFSPVWDPVLIAARKAAELIERAAEA
ncbi:MAG TPA: FAD-dependent oxidoreductase, partial [Mycobacteriales bacterium]|nr:FAD-dependent oxidoreductase [Mycobacteriales bacterium]